MKYFAAIILFPALAFSGCFGINNEKFAGAGNVQLVDSLPGQSPFITKDNKGNVVVSWVRMINDSSSVFSYAVYPNEGRSFSKPVVIPSSSNIHPHAENLPKIIFKPSGEIIALWGASNPNPKNKYSGLVYYAQSFDEGKTWSNPKKLVNDTAGYDQRYYDVALLPDGEAAIIWLDNRKTTSKEGSALYFAVTSGSNGFQNERLISEQCCPCCRTDLFVDSKGGIHVLYRGIVQDSIRDMVHAVSVDAGKTFSKPHRISNDNWVINGCPHTGPAMTENSNGLHFAWFTGGRNKGCYYTKSSDNGTSFSVPDNVSTAGSHPQITTVMQDALMIVWDETYNVNDKFYKRIGMQVRPSNGEAGGKLFITSDSAIASYPVAASLNETKALVAYTDKREEKNYIAYQLIGWK
jgi:hypothetical protein